MYLFDGAEHCLLKLTLKKKIRMTIFQGYLDDCMEFKMRDFTQGTVPPTVYHLLLESYLIIAILRVTQ